MNAEPGGPVGALRIARNALSGAGTRLVTMCVGFLLTPFIITTLGVERYGLWAVVGSLAGYLGLLDFGLGGAFVKFITEYRERGDHHAARQVVTFGIVFYAAFGLVFALPVLLLAPFLVHAFKMPVAEYGEAATLLRVMFGLLVLTMIVNVPGMVIVSMQRMDIASRNNLLGYFAYALATVAFLELGYGLRGVVAGSAVQVAVTAIVQFRSAHRLFGSIWHDPRRFDGVLVRRLFGFGGWTQLTSIFQIVNLDVGRFIAAGIVSVSSVTYYEIASKLAFFTKMFPAYVLDAVMPAAAAADARGDEGGLREMYASGTRYQIFLTLGIAGCLCGFAGPLVRVWLGKPYPFVSDLIFWLCLGYAANSFTGIGTTILRASGVPKYETAMTAIGAIANVASTIVLARAFGIVGVAMATAFGWFAASVFFIAAFGRLRPNPFWSDIFSPALRMIVACALAAGTFAWLGRQAPVAGCFANRFAGLAVLALGAASYGIAFAALTWAFGVWRRDKPVLRARWRELETKFGARA